MESDTVDGRLLAIIRIFLSVSSAYVLYLRLFQNFRSVTVCSAILSVNCAVLGILVSILVGTPVGSTIVAVDILVFLICSVLGRVRGSIA